MTPNSKTLIVGLIVGATCCGCTIDVTSDARRNSIRAVHNLTLLGRAQKAFHIRYGRYASFQELREEPRLGLAVQLTTGETDGYKFLLKNSGDRYELTAVPIVPGKTGLRSLYVDGTGIIRESWGNVVASSESAEVK